MRLDFINKETLFGVETTSDASAQFGLDVCENEINRCSNNKVEETENPLSNYLVNKVSAFEVSQGNILLPIELKHFKPDIVQSL